MSSLHFRYAEESDKDLYFRWANDALVRNNSYRKDPIAYEDHVKWFNAKLSSGNCFFYLFMNEDDIPAGQVRIERGSDETTIGISIDEAFRGKSLGVKMLEQACDDYLKKHPAEVIVAYIKKDNNASYTTFKKSGFGDEKIVLEQGIESYKLFRSRNDQ